MLPDMPKIPNEVSKTNDQDQALGVIKNERDIISEAREHDLECISKNEEFQEKSLNINARDINSKLDKLGNEVLDREINNKYKQYQLKKLEEKLDYKTKKEKNLIKQEVKGEIAKKKYEIAYKRYGYLYKPTYKEVVDENGNVVLDDEGKPVMTTVPSKNFTPNKFINIMKEAANFWANLSTNTQKIIWTTIKFLILGGVASLVIWAMITIFQKLAQSGVLA